MKGFNKNIVGIVRILLTRKSRIKHENELKLGILTEITELKLNLENCLLCFKFSNIKGKKERERLSSNSFFLFAYCPHYII